MATIKFQRAGQPAKYIPNGVNYKGYLCSEFQKGVGTPIEKGAINSYGEGETWEEYSSYVVEYRPYLNSEVISSSAKSAIKAILEKDNSVEALIAAGFEYALLKFETNDSYSVIDAQEAKKIETSAKIKEKYGFIFNHTTTTKEHDEDGQIPCYHYTLTHIKTGEQFSFIDRNLFDFGRVINPERGGIFINVENFIKHNYSFGTEEKADKFRAEHPTKSGWGLDTESGWKEVSELEIKAYEIVQKYGLASGGIRM